ncbi:unnamed protein product [Musa acuminata subsp. burmannicoides]
MGEMASGRQKITKREDVHGGCERGMVVGGGVGYRIRLPRGLAPLGVPAIGCSRRTDPSMNLIARTQTGRGFGREGFGEADARWLLGDKRSGRRRAYKGAVREESS